MPFLLKTPVVLLKSSNSTTSAIRRSWLQRQQKDTYTQKAKKTGYPSRSIFKLEQIDKMIANLIQSKKKKKTISTNNACRSKTNITTKSMKKTNCLFEIGNNVLDLGASPGSWTIYSNQKIKNGLHVSIDLCPLSNSILKKLQHMNPNFHFVHGDFCSASIQQSLKDILFLKQETDEQQQQQMKDEGKKIIYFDVIMSDMAANFTGDQLTDALRTMNLCEEALLVSLGTKRYFHDNSNNENTNNTHQQQYMDKVLQDAQKEDNNSNNNNNNGLLNKHGIFLCKFFSCGQDQEKELMEKVKGYFEHIFILKPKASRKESSEKYLVAFDYKG